MFGSYAMQVWSRGMRELAVRALAGISLVLALTVMGALFMASALHGDADHNSDDSLALGAAPRGQGLSAPVATQEQRAARTDDVSDPTRIGVVLGVLVFVGGLGVLAWGARRPEQEDVDLEDLRIGD